MSKKGKIGRIYYKSCFVLVSRSQGSLTGEEYLDQNAIPLIKELQKECQGDGDNTMEGALEKTFQGEEQSTVHC